MATIAPLRWDGESLMGWHVNQGPDQLGQFLPGVAVSLHALSPRCHSQPARFALGSPSRHRGQFASQRTRAPVGRIADSAAGSCHYASRGIAAGTGDLPGDDHGDRQISQRRPARRAPRTGERTAFRDPGASPAGRARRLDGDPACSASGTASNRRPRRYRAVTISAIRST